MTHTQKIASEIKANIKKVIVGKDDVIDLMLICLLNRAHMLIEDVPGTGKTMLVKSLAASVEADMKRVQFTPDLLPSDITGINFFNMKNSEFEFLEGPVFTNILLADEINRATPKTQAGLLECMEERQVTIDKKTYKLHKIFMVVATQNPIESMGVYPLPEAQLDRFLIKTKMEYPKLDETVEILRRFGEKSPLETLKPVAALKDIEKAQEETEKVFVHADILKYIAEITERTRNIGGIALGLSPRGALAILKVAKGYAAISGRNFVIPDDVKKALAPTINHRLITSGAQRTNRNFVTKTIEEILGTVPVPTENDINFRDGISTYDER